jgi:hypothetical protein
MDLLLTILPLAGCLLAALLVLGICIWTEGRWDK